VQYSIDHPHLYIAAFMFDTGETINGIFRYQGGRFQISTPRTNQHSRGALAANLPSQGDVRTRSGRRESES
jgi:hypothetical protein